MRDALRHARGPAERVAAADVVYVSGGNTANMLAIWRVHGIDRALREVWQRGGVLGGWSAGANCWFEDSVTDSFGPRLRELGAGLGFLPGSFCPHYDTELERRGTYTRLVREGILPPGYAADDDAAFHFEGTELREVVSQRDGARGYRVTPRRRGAARGAPAVRRVAIVASASGNGKTTLGRELARRLECRSRARRLHHGPTGRGDRRRSARARGASSPATTGSSTGVSRQARRSGARARERVVWLDLPLRVWLPRLVRRTCGGPGEDALERQPETFALS